MAYHLTKLGWEDVILLERKQLTCGSTWHAAGLVTQLRATENMTKLAKYTQELYSNLEEETGQATGFAHVGSINLATTPARLEELRRACSMARCFGVEAVEISPKEIHERWPLAYAGDLLAGFYFPKDAKTNPIDTTLALAKGARKRGAEIFEGVKVIGVTTENGRATGVVTSKGSVAAEYVVNCAGMWGRELGNMVGVRVPLQAAEHYYLITEPIEGLDPHLPILKDTDRCAYYREETGGLMIGFFEPTAVPWACSGIPDDCSFTEIPPDWDRMMPYVETAMERVPAAATVGIRKMLNGPESFTPDDRYLLGEAPELKNYFVAAGFNSLGILSAGGAGKVLAEWIIDGQPQMDIWDVDISRTLPFQSNPRFLRNRTVEILGFAYGNHWPYRQYNSARNVRKSILHDRLAEAGACFGEAAGWERANWYAPGGVEPKYQYSWNRQNWFEYNKEEHTAARNQAVLLDQSSFSKFLVQGRDAGEVLDRICANSVAVRVGKCVYTQWLNSRGTIEADLTVSRLDEGRYLIICAGATHTHVHTWLRRNIPAEAHAFITDVTSAYAMINIQGPNSRELLQRLTSADLSSEAFPYLTCRTIDLAYALVEALRITYVGELGWELYIPTEFALSVYDALVDEGRDLGLRHAGYHTLNSLRIEKGYRDFGHDIGADDTPFEAGLGFAVKLEGKRRFIGRDALLRQKERGNLTRRLVQFLLEDPEPLMYHNEPIFQEGQLVGYTTSAMYGHTLGGSVALGYINDPEGVTKEKINAGNFEIEVAGRRYPAAASLRPMFDPDNRKILA